jgi:2-amino-4-hydroxy-6-hydroxymethyldihydropteridine diphosphokinase
LSTRPSDPEGEIAYIALGSNLGDRRATLDAALNSLHAANGVVVKSVSRYLETEPLGPPNQPMYLNAAACLRTTLAPRHLLETCLGVERLLGRDRTSSTRWGPRRIDIDLLLFADMVIDEPGLKVPHPHLHQRDFVLIPLAEIAPKTLHPGLGVTIESLCRDHAPTASHSDRRE